MSIINVRDCGARGDGKALDTTAVQQAIDKAGERGGTVLVPPGVYRTGTLFLRSRITLEIQAGAVLLGSENIADYPPVLEDDKYNPDAHKDLQAHHFIIADGLEDIVIRGSGVIDGNGPCFWDPPSTCEFFTEKAQRPSPMLDLKRCKNVVLSGVTIRNSPGWTVHVFRCENVRIQGITIRNSMIGPNTDGLDINDSREVTVSDSNIECGDDAIVLKSLGGICERILVTNCIVRSRCSALKLGANESLGTIRQVAMSNCVVHDSSRGISLFCMGGGKFEDCVFSNIILENHNDMPLQCALHIDASRNPNPKRDRGIGKVRNIRIADILAKSDARILLTCEDGGMLENIFLSNIHMESPAIEDQFERARKARGLQFSPGTPDARAAKACLVAQNVRNLVVQGLTMEWPAQPQVAMHAVWAQNVQGGLLDCPLARPSTPETERYKLIRSDLRIRE